MNDPAASLAHLHDLVLPPAVPWWPPAPGWYAVFGLALAAVARLGWRSWQRWRANAYRRAALRELQSLRDAAAIAELLRRTALAVVPRPIVAGMTGAAWADWLDAGYGAAMSPPVRRLLTSGAYGRPPADQEIEALRDYAAGWIAHHRPVIPNAPTNDSMTDQ
jgi:hypothetical protein